MPKPEAKKILSRLTKRIYEKYLSRPAENYFLPTSGMIIMVAVSVVFAAFVLMWSSGITPPVLESSVAVSVVPIDEYTAAVTIISIEPEGTTIKYLTYSNSGSGIVNSSLNESIPVRDVGDSGFIPVSANGKIKIVAVFDSMEKVVYTGGV